MNMTDNLANIPVDDDFNLAPPEAYPDGGLDVLPAGWYDFVLTGHTRYAGTSEDPRKPRGVSVELTVVGSNDDRFLNRRTGKLMTWTKSFERNGARVSGLGDFIRGISDTAAFSDIESAEAILDGAVDRALPIQIRVDWEAFDKSAFDAQGGSQLGDQEKKDLRNRLTIKGMGNFPKWEDGTPKSTVAGPGSGEEITAQLRVRQIARSSKRKDLKFRLA